MVNLVNFSELTSSQLTPAQFSEKKHLALIPDVIRMGNLTGLPSKGIVHNLSSCDNTGLYIQLIVDIMKVIQLEESKKGRLHEQSVLAMHAMARYLVPAQPAVKTDMPGFVQVTFKDIHCLFFCNRLMLILIDCIIIFSPSCNLLL